VLDNNEIWAFVNLKLITFISPLAQVQQFCVFYYRTLAISWIGCRFEVLDCLLGSYTCSFPWGGGGPSMVPQLNPGGGYGSDVWCAVLQPEGEDSLKRTQLEALAVLNGTFRGGRRQGRDLG
jgi:hypothetical protein